MKTLLVVNGYYGRINKLSRAISEEKTGSREDLAELLDCSVGTIKNDLWILRVLLGKYNVKIIHDRKRNTFRFSKCCCYTIWEDEKFEEL